VGPAGHVIPPTVLIGPGQNIARIGPKTTKHNRGVRRLNRMHAPIRLDRPIRPVVMTAFRSGLAVVVAMLLILVLLPAVIAVQASAAT
jgi:hypothetical protein